MLRQLLLPALLAGTLASAAVADGAINVQLPTLPELDRETAELLMGSIVQSVVIGQNCPAYRSTQGEWTLMTGTSDMIAASLGLDASEEDDRFWKPAFAAMDQPDACDRFGPQVREVLEILKGYGGGTDPI